METKKWLSIQIPLVIFIIIVWWLFFPQYNVFKFVSVVWIIKNFYPVFVGHTNLTNMIFNLNKTSVKFKKQSTTRVIPVNGEEWAFDYVLSPLKNMSILEGFFAKRYKHSKNINKPEKTAIFFIRDLIIKGVNGNKPFDVDISERDICYFVWIGYKRQQDKRTRRSSYSRNYWLNKIDIFVFYGCIYLLENGGCLVNRKQGWTGENPYTPVETMKILKGEK